MENNKNNNKTGKKASKDKNVVPLNVANMVTLSHEKKHETPIVDEYCVEYAKNFVDENEK